MRVCFSPFDRLRVSGCVELLKEVGIGGDYVEQHFKMLAVKSWNRFIFCQTLANLKQMKKNPDLSEALFTNEQAFLPGDEVS